MGKLQAPTSRIQRNTNQQTPSRVLLCFTPIAYLGIRIWDFIGIWSLGFGVYLVLGAWLLVLFSGCSVGPNYKRPTIDSPAAFRGDSSPTNKSIGDLDWWNVYQDATLQALVREAFTNNYDLGIALTRMEQASALAMQARSQFVPSVDYNGT